MNCANKSKRRLNESRELIRRVYHFLKAEYEFTLSQKRCNCDMSHMSNILQRTADAVGAGVTPTAVQRIIEVDTNVPQYHITFPNESKHKRKLPNYDDLINIEYGDSVDDIDNDELFTENTETQPDVDKNIEPVLKKVKVETDSNINSFQKKLVDFINFEEDIKQIGDIKEEIITEEDEEEVIEDDGEEQQVLVIDSITIKDECIM